MEELTYFFSYARDDSEVVLKLATELRAVGARLWLDQLDILAGQRWDRAVEDALVTCQGMIAVLSPASVVSQNVMDEVSYALEEGKLVVPILLRPCAIPFRLRRVQYVDLTANYETGFSHLLRALCLGQPLPPLAPAAPQELFVRDVSEEGRRREEMEGYNLSLDQTAQAISVTRLTLRDYIKSGRLKANPDGTIEAVELLRAGFIMRTLPRRGEEEVGSE
jgi:hypothetical protein